MGSEEASATEQEVDQASFMPPTCFLGSVGDTRLRARDSENRVRGRPRRIRRKEESALGPDFTWVKDWSLQML